MEGAEQTPRGGRGRARDSNGVVMRIWDGRDCDPANGIVLRGEGTIAAYTSNAKYNLISCLLLRGCVSLALASIRSQVEGLTRPLTEKFALLSTHNIHYKSV